MRTLLAISLAAAIAGPAAAIVYVNDDGTAEAGYGLAQGGSFMWLNHFTVMSGGTIVSSILGVFGDVPNGAPVTAHYWSDPNGDGNPSDAVSLSSGSSVTANAGTNVFNTFLIPSIIRPVGTSFFVGFRMSHAPAMRPAALDLSSSNGNSWFVAGNDPNNLSGAVNVSTMGSSVDGNWMVRAGAVPEPASLAALAAGIGALLLRRRRA